MRKSLSKKAGVITRAAGSRPGGAVLTAVIGMVAFKDPVNVVTIGSIVLIIAGVVGLQLAGADH